MATRVRARVTDGANWSPPADATYLPLQALTNLTVTEIYYHPTGEPGLDEELFEFLELQNRGAFALDLSGIRFSSAISFAFTNGTMLAPGGFFVLAPDAVSFSTRFPGAVRHGLYGGRLNNGGEVLSLQNALNDTIFSFVYSDQPPWPASADGSGDSLHRIYFDDPNESANWCAALPTPGALPPAACRDADGDGLSDEWEVANNFDMNSVAGVNGGNGDPDHDNMTNIQEFIAGTDPHDDESFLKIESISASAGLVITFVARARKTYTVQHTTGAANSSWTNLADVAARTTNHVAVVYDESGTATRLYRLVTPRQ